MQKVPEYPFGLSPAMIDDAFRRATAQLDAAEDAAAPGRHEREAPAPLDEDVDRMLAGHELLLAVRQPIEWLLALASRLASGDPEDVAAIDRLTAAFHSRLARGAHGVQVADVLTAFGILVGALDPEILLESATKSITDGVITIVAYEGAEIAAQLARLANRVPTAIHHATRSSTRVHPRRRARTVG